MYWITLILFAIVISLVIVRSALLTLLQKRTAALNDQINYTLRLLSQINQKHSHNVKEIERLNRKIERLNNKLNFKRNESN